MKADTSWRKVETTEPSPINPPFDGGAPCPMCRQEIRACSSYAHNMLNRWRVPVFDPTSPGMTRPPAEDAPPEPKFWVKLDDLVRCSSGEAGFADPAKAGAALETIKSSEPAVQAHIDAMVALVREYVKHKRPANHDEAVVVAAAIKSQVEAVRATMPAVNQLSEQHFDDMRHAGGTENILRSQRGWAEERGGAYDWTIDLAPKESSNPDLRHNVCGGGLILHAHFRERLKRDPAWYGRVYCLGCQQLAPIAQFECRVTA